MPLDVPSGLDLSGHRDIHELLVREIPDGRVVPVLGGVCDRPHPLREALHAGVGDAAHVGNVDPGAESPARQLGLLQQRARSRHRWREDVGGDGQLLLPGRIEGVDEHFRPAHGLLVVAVRAADEDGGRVAVRVVPEVLEGVEDRLLLLIVEDVRLEVLRQHVPTLFLGLGRHALDVVAADGAGGGGGAAHVLQLVPVVVGDLAAEVLVDARYVRDVLDALPADRRAEHAPVGLLARLHIDQPLRLAALVGHQAEHRRLAEHGAEHFHPRAVAVGSDAEDRLP